MHIFQAFGQWTFIKLCDMQNAGKGVFPLIQNCSCSFYSCVPSLCKLAKSFVTFAGLAMGVYALS